MAVPNPDEIYPSVKTYEEKQRDAQEREKRRIARLPKHIYAWNIAALGASGVLLIAIILLASNFLSPQSTVGIISGVSFTFLLAMIWFFVTRGLVLRMIERFSLLGYAGGGTMVIFYIVSIAVCAYVVGIIAPLGSLLFYVLLLCCHIAGTALLTRLVIR